MMNHLSSQSENILLQCSSINKEFSGVNANSDVSITVGKSQIHALLGENGAGKSTMVKIIYGLLQPDSGTMRFSDEEYAPKSPKDARALGVGMVFQHFSLFEPLSAFDNILLGLDKNIDVKSLREEVKALSESYGLEVNLSSYIGDLSAGERQRVEIIRALLQKPKLLIMDEPTSVLTPFECEKLFKTLKKLASEGTSILYISHKLKEISFLCDTASVLRKGELIGEYDPKTMTAKALGELMVGQTLSQPKRPIATKKKNRVLSVSMAEVKPDTQFGVMLKNIKFDVYQSEILGIGGVAGNGQEELMQLITGEKIDRSIDIKYLDSNIQLLNPHKRREMGIAFAPEERLGHSAVGSLSLSENSLITDPKKRFLTNLGFIDFEELRNYTESVIEKFNVKTTGGQAIASSLSGGNLQKFVVGREIGQRPSLLVVNQPTWGVDALSAANIREAIVEIANNGAAVILISQDLDELLEISNRVGFLTNGQLSMPSETTNIKSSDIGALMGGLSEGETN